MRYRPPYIGCMVTCCKLCSLPVNIQMSKNFPEEVRSQKSGVRIKLRTAHRGPLEASLVAPPAAAMVGLGRIELPTSPLSGVRSSQLSYRPTLVASGQWPVASQLVELVGIEPATS